MKTCKHCGEKIGRYDMECRVNRGLKGKTFVLCESCRDELANNGKIIQCEACGEYFSADALVDEEIHSHSFTECPNCHRDVVEQLTREEFTDEHCPIRFAVVVHFFNGPRGYVVLVPTGERASVVKKLAEKVDLSGASEITYAEIILGEDEF